jgi:hypothetical protein
VYSGRDVLVRVGSRWGGLGVAEAVEGWEKEGLRECQSLLLTLSLEDQSSDR